MKRQFLVFVITFITIVNFAQTKLPTFFGDNMVLQQNTIVAIWGNDIPNKQINIIASWGKKASVKTDKNGKWRLYIQTVKAGGPYHITVEGSDKITYKNILLGEVWLCLGQSNMGWTLENTIHGTEDISNARNPNLRIYQSARQSWHEPKTDCPTGKWNEATPYTASQTSAVSYYFAEKLQKALNTPVGIIVQAYAGTPIEAWMPWDVQKNNERSNLLKKHLDATTVKQKEKLGYTKEIALAKYNKELELYTKQMAANDTIKNTSRSRKPPIITKPANLSYQYPSNIYNAMVHPVLGFGIQGIIWYQGERNSKSVQQALDFKSQLKLLIEFYRSEWNKMSNGNVIDDFYFSMTQLPSWNAAQSKPVENVEAPWAVSRNIMLEIVSEVPNTAIAVSIDTGDPVLLHPKNKRPIGYRHAFNVLHDIYNKKFVAHGPFYDSQKIDENKITLSFNGVGNGLMAAKKGDLDSFAIAGEDQKWHWADAKIVGKTIVVSSKDVSFPVAVRYAWAMNPSERNLLYNNEGLPASPFRTDSWELFKEGSKEVKVFKPKKGRGYKAKDWDRPKMQ